MKKILSILMILVLVGGVAFAQVEPEVRGSATLSWGIDFGAGSETDYTKGGADNHAVATHGFYNSNNFQIRLPFFKRQSFAGGSANKEADVYADVSFKATPVATGWTATGGAASVKAALHFYGAYMTVYGQPSFEADKALGWNPINWDPNTDDLNGWFNPAFTGFGTKIGYKNAGLMNLDVALKLASNGSWKQDGSDGTKPWDGTSGNKRREKDSKYAFGLDFSMQPVEKYLGVEATVNATLGRLSNKATLNNPDDYGYNTGITPTNVGGEKGESGMVNFGVAFTSEPIEKLTVKLGFDGVTGVTYTDEGKTKETLGWDAGLSVGYKWVDAALYFAGTGTKYQGYNIAGDDPTKFKNHGINMAAHLAFVSEAEGDTNLVPGLAFHATVNAYDLLAKRSTQDMDKSLRQALAGLLNAGPTATIPIIPGLTTATTTYADLLELALRSKYAQLPMGFNLGASYKYSMTDVMWVQPYAEFYAETNHFAQHADTYASDPDKVIDKLYLGMAYEIGVKFQPIEKVEVKASWEHGKLNENKYEAGFNGGDYMIGTPINNKSHNGTFVLSLKLTY
ncbi:MSP porin [Treponema putidum]|uniref:Major surface protein n=1 Tax=Treponema putidum TaxID=221027 RepID=A0A088RCR0_9SPIR|nr:MSP porin [Treponema putidum]AIN93360.1 major surface protein MSP [Treponema putidum]AMD40791.2 major surface protein [Treponema putidum]TWI71701.1 major outer sheath family protein [Treponema putidum]